MRDLTRLFVPCVLALACIGAPYADARPQGTRVSVVICVLPAEPTDCGPQTKVKGGKLIQAWAEQARHAGVVSAQRPKIKCPPSPTCTAQASGGLTISLKAQPKADASYGTYVFDHWEGRCTGTVPTSPCSLRVSKNDNARVVAVFRSSG